MKIIKMQYLQKISVLVYYFSILVFVIALNFEHNPPSGWYQQFLPELNNEPMSDIKYLDSRKVCKFYKNFILLGNSMIYNIKK